MTSSVMLLIVSSLAKHATKSTPALATLAILQTNYTIPDKELLKFLPR